VAPFAADVFFGFGQEGQGERGKGVGQGRGLRPAHASRDLWPSVRSASASLILNLNLNLTLMVTYLCDWRAAVALARGVGSSTTPSAVRRLSARFSAAQNGCKVL